MAKSNLCSASQPHHTLDRKALSLNPRTLELKSGTRPYRCSAPLGITMGSILRRYILEEVASLFALALLMLVTLLIIQRIIQITEWVVNRGVGLGTMLSLVLLLLPYFLVLVTPMALLLATLLAVNRLSADCEIIAIKASGIGIKSLFPPVLLLGGFCTALTLFLSLYLVPRARVWTENILFDIARSSAKSAVRVKNFYEITPGMVIYVDEVENDKLKGVLLAQSGIGKKIDAKDVESVIVTAREGEFLSDGENLENYLFLYDGDIHVRSVDGRTYRQISFSKYSFKLDIEEQKRRGIERASDFEVMSVELLRSKYSEYSAKYKESLKGSDEASVEKRRAYRTALVQIGVSIHQKFSIPFACLALALWGIPLGIQPPRASRYQGVVMSIVLAILYYLLVSGGKILATKFLVTPALAMWLPNVVVLVSGIYFLRRASADKPMPFAEALVNISEMMKEFFKKDKDEGK